MDLRRELEEAKHTLSQDKLQFELQQASLCNANTELQQTLEETQKEFELLIDQHQQVSQQLAECQQQLKAALRVPAELKLQHQEKYAHLEERLAQTTEQNADLQE